MTEKIVALDVGSTCLRGIEATIKRGIPQITHISEVPLDYRIVQAGEIVAPDSLPIAISRLWKEGKFDVKNVLSLAYGNSIINRVVDNLPWAQKEDFKKMLPYVLRDRLPFEIEDYYLDEHTLQEYYKSNNPDRFKTVLVTVVNKQYVDLLIGALEANNLHPKGIDALPLSLIRAHAASEPYDEDSVVASIELGATVTTIVLHQNHQPIYLHTAPGVGGARITERLARDLKITTPEAEFLKISLSKAEEDREEKSTLVSKPGGTIDKITFKSFSEDQVNQALSIVSQEVSNLIGHINDILEDYYTDPDLRVAEIILSGGGAKLETFASRLSSETSISVRLAAPFGQTKPKKMAKEVFDNQHKFAAAFGLLLGDNV